MKLGIEIKIDVTKIEKDRLFVGKKGKYLTMIAFVDTETKDQYGNSGMVTHDKKEGEEKAPILGNTKVFWSGNAGNQNKPAPQKRSNGLDDEPCPF